MDGYTVDEAAEVLGIPGERVWELITTGVLAASSEGRSGMRVFLQPRTTTDMASLSGSEPRGSEATPFRELLTEFRNLTERYGQALLALGEARGEVASLRGRVELLEARIDVRHAPARIAPVGSWPSAETLVHDEDEASLDEMAGLAPPAAEQEIGREDVSSAEAFAEGPPADEEPGIDQAPVDVGVTDEAVAASAPEETDGRARRRGRSRAGHPNLADIPAALARAEDPSAAELRSAAAEEASAEPVGMAPQAVAEPDDVAPELGAAPSDEMAPQAVAEPEEPAPQTAAEPDEVAAEAGGAQPDEQVPEAAPSEDLGAVLEDEASEADTPPYDLGSAYTTAFDEPDWIVEDDLWRSVPQAGVSNAADSVPATDRLPDAEPAPDEQRAEAAAEPAAAETDGWASVEPAGEEPEASVSVEPAAEADREAAAASGPDAEQAPPAIEEISADVAFSIGAPEPDEQLAEAEGEEAEPPGDFDAFMAAADLGSPSAAEPDYAAELENSTAGWHSAIAPAEEVIDPREAESPPEAEEAVALADASATATSEQPEDSTVDSWDASEMEAIRALLARANAIDREQLEVEASSHPLEPDQEESVREIVASGAGDESSEEPRNAEEPIADQSTPDASPDEPPLSLAPHLELPGSNDLGEAMAALEAISSEEPPERPEPDGAATAGSSSPLWPEAERRVWSGGTAEPWTTPVPTMEIEPTIEPETASSPGEEVLAHLDFGAPSSYSPAPMTQDRSDPAAAASDEDAEWSESHEGAAGRAFRRLRRIFPG